MKPSQKGGVLTPPPKKKTGKRKRHPRSEATSRLRSQAPSAGWTWWRNWPSAAAPVAAGLALAPQPEPRSRGRFEIGLSRGGVNKNLRVEGELVRRFGHPKSWLAWPGESFQNKRGYQLFEECHPLVVNYCLHGGLKSRAPGTLAEPLELQNTPQPRQRLTTLKPMEKKETVFMQHACIFLHFFLGMLCLTPPPPPKKKTRKRLARKHFSPGAHPTAETPFYIAAASVSARGDAQCVWSHESSISSSYERKHGSARSHIFTSVTTRRVKLVKLETNYKQKEEQSIAKLTRRPQFLQSTLAQLSSVQDGSAQLGSVKVGSTQATFREWLCATGSVQVGSARACSAQCALHELRRAISHESGLRKLHRSRLLRASSSLQAAARKRSMQVALRKCSEQVALRQLLRASALRMCSVQVGLCKLLCASCSEQVLPELWECTSRTNFCT